MVRRKIIRIDESLCNGCGSCVFACSEGAIEMVNGKARVVSESSCDGLGACLGECPVGALTIVESEAADFDEEAAIAHLRQSKASDIPLRAGEMGEEKIGEEKQELQVIAPCSFSVKRAPGADRGRHLRKLGPSSQLSSWPIQVRLAHADAPYFKEGSLLLAADCSAFACPSIGDFIKGRAVLIGCPKLDDAGMLVKKLAEIMGNNDIKDLTVLHMEVPCCSNLVRLVLEARKRSGKNIPFSQFVCMIEGSVEEEATANFCP